jgi:hypothetical protein
MVEHGIMTRLVALFPPQRPQPLHPQARSAPFLGRRGQQDALYRTIPPAVQGRQTATMPAAETADRGVRFLACPNIVAPQEPPASP